jgi:hypothetical protein
MPFRCVCGARGVVVFSGEGAGEEGSDGKRGVGAGGTVAGAQARRNSSRKIRLRNAILSLHWCENKGSEL